MGTTLIAFGFNVPPASAQAVDCSADGLRGWQVITNASGGTAEQALCNFKVSRTAEGKASAHQAPSVRRVDELSADGSA